MTNGRTALQELSKSLFGQVHRLTVMVAIAKSDGQVNPTDLANDLRLPQSALQAPLRDLTDAGLLTRQDRGGRRTIYQRAESKAWDWVLDLEEQAQAADRRSSIRRISS
jgi:DNA-binding MarR family transcriptional regulator